MRIKESMYYEIINCVPDVPPESGGILGAEKDIICHLYIDAGTRHGKTYYWPDVSSLNKEISEWSKQGICLAGIFHSHVPDGTELSEADKRYAADILMTMPETDRSLLFPIVIPRKCILFYRVTLEDNRITVFHENIVLVK